VAVTINGLLCNKPYARRRAGRFDHGSRKIKDADLFVRADIENTANGLALETSLHRSANSIGHVRKTAGLGTIAHDSHVLSAEHRDNKNSNHSAQVDDV